MKTITYTEHESRYVRETAASCRVVMYKTFVAPNMYGAGTDYKTHKEYIDHLIEEVKTFLCIKYGIKEELFVWKGMWYNSAMVKAGNGFDLHLIYSNDNEDTNVIMQLEYNDQSHREYTRDIVAAIKDKRSGLERELLEW